MNDERNEIKKKNFTKQKEEREKKLAKTKKKKRNKHTKYTRNDSATEEERGSYRVWQRANEQASERHITTCQRKYDLERRIHYHANYIDEV